MQTQFQVPLMVRIGIFEVPGGVGSLLTVREVLGGAPRCTLISMYRIAFQCTEHVWGAEDP